MHDIVLGFILAIAGLGMMLICMPFLQVAEVLARRYPTERHGELPNLAEEESGPQFTGDVA